ncbi:ABC transporter permease [Asticcacaulis sp. 201]|uniref:ABC transporter permease n=1 Tax=Asticcacaulis sp. 201 TaxID=3028787 RepID=UPI002916E483|nr:ABC transporter permease [Asticcacaulis sp. 201]MDV6332809.1 ABC transporter permease [Asticcacaulis sp. 201]
MRNTFLIARREYLAFVRTVGFWLSLVTLPLLITGIILVPLLLRQTSPVQTLSVAVLDLTGEGLDGDLRAIIRAKATPPNPEPQSDGMRKIAAKIARPDIVRLVDLPRGLTSSLSRAEAEARIPALLDKTSVGASNILVAYNDAGTLHFDIWSIKSQKNNLARIIEPELQDVQYYRLARAHDIDPKLAHALRTTQAEVNSLTRREIPSKAAGGGFGAFMGDEGPGFVGFLIGFGTWMTIFSSSMILLGGVIEEKSSKVLEVLLASTSTESLLIGKVLGVAGVLLTVASIWSVISFVLGTYGLSAAPPEVAASIKAAFNGLFSPLHLVLLAVYFVCGYLMYGVSFAAIGAFCETQKDAQAIMGPVMMVLMIPMLCMQAALSAPNSPIIQYLSYVPIFTPFLMPLRLLNPLPWWEIVLTFGGMLLVGGFMIMVGRKAFRQGALTGGKLTWGTLFRIATEKPST